MQNSLSDGISLALAGGEELLEALGSVGTAEGGVGDEGLKLGTLGTGESSLDGLKVGLDLLEGLAVLGQSSHVRGRSVLAGKTVKLARSSDRSLGGVASGGLPM